MNFNLEWQNNILQMNTKWLSYKGFQEKVGKKTYVFKTIVNYKNKFKAYLFLSLLLLPFTFIH